MNKIRNLKAEEIECRINTIKQTGFSLLLYKDARCDMKILDETFGVTGWQRSHELINGGLFCTISIWDEDKKQWVCKQDIGTESYTEKEKGQASDAFKRAGTNVGIGRELYAAPHIWIPALPGETKDTGKKKQNGESIYTLKFGVSFDVSYIETSEDKEIKALQIKDNAGRVRFSFNINNAPAPELTEQLLICKKCGTLIEDVHCDDGSIIYAQDFYKKYKGLCRDCVKRAKSKKTADKQ